MEDAVFIEAGAVTAATVPVAGVTTLVPKNPVSSVYVAPVGSIFARRVPNVMTREPYSVYDSVPSLRKEIISWRIEVRREEESVGS